MSDSSPSVEQSKASLSQAVEDFPSTVEPVSDAAPEPIPCLEKRVESTTTGKNEIDEENQDRSTRPSPTQQEDNEQQEQDNHDGRKFASLYCPKNGRLHSVLLDFDIRFCLKCNQDLRNTDFNQPVEENSPGSNVTKADDASTTSVDEDTDQDGADITHTVEFRDDWNSQLGTVSWPRPFDLMIARHGALAKKSSVLDVLTVLGTTVAHDRYRAGYEVEELMRTGILNNAAIEVEIVAKSITIKSPTLIKILRSVALYYPSMNLRGRTVTIDEPYTFIAHHLGQLEEYRDTAQNVNPSHRHISNMPNEEIALTSSASEDPEDHLGTLLNYIKDVYQDQIKDELSRHTRGVCTFRMLWLLFKPGATVYYESSGRLAAYVVSNVNTEPAILSKDERNAKPYTITMWNLAFDGKFVSRSAHTAKIYHFEGERDVITLKIFPCDFLDKKDDGQTRARLERNGKRWYELLRGGQVHYSGRLLDSHVVELHGRVYIDNASYYEQEADYPTIDEVHDMGDDIPDEYIEVNGDRKAKCHCDECQGRRPHPPAGFQWAHYDVLDPWKEENLETEKTGETPRHRYLLCGRGLHGLVLKTRKWAILDAEYCLPPKINAKAIQSLVMPEDRKTMIEALVKRFSNHGALNDIPKPWRADHMENKGEGQIFLLHGSPGVGKTYTAECIAEFTGRALLSLTCGDIGIDDNQAEKNLTKWFQLAETWGAVLLIDEADVYLERREVSDLQRNSLVSVFLRSIEYYRGILFLTTNRVGIFDDAFMSRIHVIIAYDKLGITERTKIWEQFFEKLGEDRQDFIITKRARKYVLEDKDMRNLKWNGREIRNAFQTAVALAEYRYMQKDDKTSDDGPTLDQRDFESVCDMTSRFKEYLFNVHGFDEEDRAFRNRTRAGNIIYPSENNNGQ